jgi:hypothetical protein
MKGAKTVKHPKRWFINRVGKEIVCPVYYPKPPNLFDVIIRIQSSDHATALFEYQEKGYRYINA